MSRILHVTVGPRFLGRPLPLRGLAARHHLLSCVYHCSPANCTCLWYSPLYVVHLAILVDMLRDSDIAGLDPSTLYYIISYRAAITVQTDVYYIQRPHHVV